MALKLKIKYSKEGLKDSLASAKVNRYDGPTPPAGVYKAKFRKVRLQRNKADTHHMFAIWLTLQNEGEQAKYNGASVNAWLVIPNDDEEKYSGMRYNSIDSLFKAASNGRVGVQDVLDALGEGRYQAEDPDDKGAQEITAIGKLKLTGDEIITIKTKVEQYNGDDRAALHYVLDTADNSDEDEDLDYADSDDDEDLDLDGLLEN